VLVVLEATGGYERAAVAVAYATPVMSGAISQERRIIGGGKVIGIIAPRPALRRPLRRTLQGAPLVGGSDDIVDKIARPLRALTVLAF
jgi:hypothetical protein